MTNTMQHRPTGETLPELIRRRLGELERSARGAAELSHGLVTHSTLTRYANGEIRRLSLKAAQGVALAVDVPLDEVLRAAGLPMTPGPFELPARAHLLTDKERRAVITVIDALLSARGVDIAEPPPAPAKATRPRKAQAKVSRSQRKLERQRHASTGWPVVLELDVQSTRWK